MRWYTKNPELARPVAVCLLLVAGAVVAEAVIPAGDIEAARNDDAVIFETKVNVSTGKSDRAASATSASPYFDQDDPVE